jgi:hypothetical protein
VDKVKWSLRAITVCCILIPLLVLGFTSGNKLTGLIVPPQLQSLINQNGQNNSNVLNSTIAQLGINPNNIQAPKVENLTYDSSTGIATLTLNLTNPLTYQSLEVSNFSLTVASNGTQPVTIQLAEPINIAANQTGDIAIPLTSSDPQALQSLISGNQTMSNLQFSNLNLDANGITVHIGNLNQLSQSSNSNGNNNPGNNNNNGVIGNNNMGIVGNNNNGISVKKIKVNGGS